MSISGINTATNVTEQVRCLQQTGISVIGRYYASVNPWKRLTAEEVRSLGRHGLGLLSLWQESGNHRRYFTQPRGQEDGWEASLLGTHLGQPPTTPIYFAVDYDALPRDALCVRAYLRGVQQGLRKHARQRGGGGFSLGVYGSTWVLDWSRQLGLVTHYMQAYPPGWSGGENARGWPGHSVRQLASNRRCCGMLVDPLWVGPESGVWYP